MSESLANSMVLIDEAPTRYAGMIAKFGMQSGPSPQSTTSLTSEQLVLSRLQLDASRGIASERIQETLELLSAVAAQTSSLVEGRPSCRQTHHLWEDMNTEVLEGYTAVPTTP
jgi:hypothetical protein